MTPAEEHGPADFIEQLTSYSEVLRRKHQAAAEDLQPESAEQGGASTESAERLLRAKKCLEALERLWPSQPDPLEDVAGRSAQSTITASHFGRFEILSDLASGGFGVVFRAFDPVLQRKVALKIPHPETLTSAAKRAWFTREAKCAAILDHPNLVTVFEAGEINGICYIASALCEGLSLSAWLEQQSERPKPRTAGLIILFLAEAIHHAHVRGVLHCDITPGNVVLEPVDPAEAITVRNEWREMGFVPKLTDFGLAKFLDAGTGVTTKIIAGTPEYMPPERLLGGAPSVRTDVYGLGGLLHLLLTGAPPSQATKNQSHRDEPRDLFAICRKCLETKPEDRYASVAELSEDLQRWLENKPVSVRTPSLGERVSKWVRRRPMEALSLLLSGLLLVALFASGFAYVLNLRWTMADLRSMSRITKAQQQQLIKERQVADGFASALRERLYDARIKLAHEAWQDADLKSAMRHLDACRPKRGESDLRDFSWFYLAEVCKGDGQHVLSGKQRIASLSFLPDSKTIVSLDCSGVLQSGNVTQAALTTATTLPGPIAIGELCAANGLMAYAGTGRTITIWDTAENKRKCVLGGHVGGVTSMAFSDDGTVLVSTGKDGMIRTWDLATAELLSAVAVSASDRSWICYSPSLSRFAIVDSNTVAIHNCSTGELLTELRFASELTAVAFSHDDQLLATDTRRGKTQIWNLESGTELISVTQPIGWQQSLRFSSDDRLLIGGDFDSAIRVYDVATGKVLKTLRGHLAAVERITVAPDGNRIASADANGNVIVWDLSETREPQMVITPNAKLNVAFSSHEPVLFTFEEGRQVGWWDVPSGSLLERVAIDDRDYIALAMTSDDRTLLAATTDQVQVFDSQLKEVVGVLPIQGGSIRSIAVAPNSSHVVIAVQKSTTQAELQLWDIVNRAIVRTITCPGDVSHAVSYAPRGNKVAAADENATIWIWDLDSTAPPLTFTGHRGVITHLAFSSDGRLMASSSLDRSVRIWDTEMASEPRALLGHRAGVRWVSFSPDGKTLASCSDSRAIRLWNVATGNDLMTFQLPTGTPTSVEFSPNGRVLAATMDHGEHGAVVLWRTEHP